MPTQIYISLNSALEIDLFDDVKYKHLKDLFDPNTDYEEYMEELDFIIWMEDIPNENYCPKTNRYLKKKITFELEYTKFEKIYEYLEGSVREHKFKELISADVSAFEVNK